MALANAPFSFALKHALGTPGVISRRATMTMISLNSSRAVGSVADDDEDDSFGSR